MSRITTIKALDDFDTDCREIREWWKTDRWNQTIRPYSAEDVAKFRGSRDCRQTFSSSNCQSNKLWLRFQQCVSEKSFLPTFGALDPVQVVQMAKHLKTIYVSGWQCSSTASTTNEPGPDFADYPSNTVPNKVDQLFRAQAFHDACQKHDLKSGKIKSDELIDYFAPIIADGDTGHGGITAVMKLVKQFIERGAAGVHLEDQKPGTKKCGHMGGKVLVSVGEHVDRLIAARLMADILGTNTIFVARTDAEAATLLDSNADPRDHPFILGAKDSKEWTLESLCTFPEYCLSMNPSSKVFVDTTKKWIIEGYSLDRMKTDAIESLRLSPTTVASFDWEKPRTREGYYRIKPSTEYCIIRGAAFAPYADVLWMESKKPVYDQCAEFARGIRNFPINSKYCKSILLGYNLSPSFNWDASGMTDAQIGNFQKEIGKLGYVWQFITLAGFHLSGLHSDVFAKKYADENMLAYVRDVQREERKHGVELLTHQHWSGADYMDDMVNVVTGGQSSTNSQGADSTEKQFVSKV